MGQDSQQLIATILSFGVLALVLGLRMRRMQAVRRLKVEQLWILPVFFALVVAALYVSHPPRGIVWLYALLALGAGLGLGWLRGRLMAITVDPQTHEVSQQGSMAAMIFIFVLVGARFAVRSMIGSGADIDPALMLSVTDVLLALGLGFVTGQAVEMGLRARALLAQAKGRWP